MDEGATVFGEVIASEQSRTSRLLQRNDEGRLMSETWTLYVWGRKGWTEEATYDNRKDGKHYLDEWREEFPECRFKLVASKTPKGFGGSS